MRKRHHSHRRQTADANFKTIKSDEKFVRNIGTKHQARLPAGLFVFQARLARRKFSIRNYREPAGC